MFANLLLIYLLCFHLSWLTSNFKYNLLPLFCLLLCPSIRLSVRLCSIHLHLILLYGLSCKVFCSLHIVWSLKINIRFKKTSYLVTELSQLELEIIFQSDLKWFICSYYHVLNVKHVTLVCQQHKERKSARICQTANRWATSFFFSF